MEIDLKNREWGEFVLEEIFNIYTGGDLIISNIKKGDYPVISHSISNNGIAAWTEVIEGKTLFKSEITISLADRGNFHAFVQKIDFYIGTRVKALEAKFHSCNQNILNFICPLINKQSVKFSYGNNATSGIDKLKILLPINSKGKPDYAFMEQYMIYQEQNKLEGYINHIENQVVGLVSNKVVKLDQKKWVEFDLKDIFNDIQRGKRLKKGDHLNGKIPYISSTGLNNGVDNFVGNRNRVRIFSNCLTIANSGSVGVSFYQPFSFVASDHVTKLGNGTFNKYIYLFISTIVSRLGEKYSFNREINDNRIQKEKIMLPVNSNLQPDYDYMELYMFNLERKKIELYKKHISTRISELEAKSSGGGGKTA